MIQKNKHEKGLIICVLFMVFAIFSCKPDPLEYARPENLAGTVYTQLESLETFSYYLQAIDKTDFKEPLSRGGSWTVFVPTDEAFEQYMTDNGYATFSAIPEDKLLSLVEYSIVVDAWNTTTLTYYRNQFYEGQSLRRRTQYSESVVEVSASDYPNFIDSELDTYLVDMSVATGGTRTITYFLPSYLASDRRVTGYEDYEFMFPGQTFGDDDMRVFESDVSQKNIVAENGIIYALDKVLEPRSNLYQNLTSEEYEGKFDLFKSLVDRFGYFSLLGDREIDESGTIAPVYTISFLSNPGTLSGHLPYNINDEFYPRFLNNVDRTPANTAALIAPTNQALLDYLDSNSVLGQFYDSYDDMPLDVLSNFLEPFFFKDFFDLGPSHIGEAFNTRISLVDYQLSDANEKKLCSNGFFVGVDKIYTNDSFSTVMGPLLLDSEYTIMLKMIQELGIDVALESKGIDFSIFGVKNNQFVNVADPNSATRKITVLDDITTEDLSVIYMQVEGDSNDANNRIYPDPDAVTPSSSDITYVTNTLKDIVLNQIVEQSVDFNSNNYYPTKSGEFIYATGGNSVLGGGNLTNGMSADVEFIQEMENGNFYEMSTFIERPLRFTAGALVDNATTFSMFFEVLSSADALVNIPDYSLDKLVSFLNLQRTFTLLAPNNNAVLQAVSDGAIPDPSPGYLSTLNDLELAIAKKELLDFAKKHFIQQAIPTDGVTSDVYPSLFFDTIIDFAPVYDEFLIENSHSPSSLIIKNVETGDVVAQTGVITNLLSKRVVIHEINEYLK